MRAFWVIVGWPQPLFSFPTLSPNFLILIPLLLFLDSPAQMNAMNACGARSLKKSSANWDFLLEGQSQSQPRLASSPFASWQCLHVKWLHSWTVNSKACAPTAAWQGEVIFCMELKSLLSSSGLKNHFKKTFPPHIFWSQRYTLQGWQPLKTIRKRPLKAGSGQSCKRHNFNLIESLGTLGENRLCPWDEKWLKPNSVLRWLWNRLEWGMAKLVVLIHGLIDFKISLWMGKGDIISLGVICMHVLSTLTWLLSPGASSCSSLWPPAPPGICGCPAPAPASPHTHRHRLFPALFSCAASPFAGRWLWAGHPTLLSPHRMLLYPLAAHLHTAASFGTLSKSSSRTKPPKYKR